MRKGYIIIPMVGRPTLSIRPRGSNPKTPKTPRGTSHRGLPLALGRWILDWTSHSFLILILCHITPPLQIGVEELLPVISLHYRLKYNN